ncbi:MAG: AEC family transporter [Lachnospiraceae bacterium]
MALQVINMVLPVLVMIAIGCLCNKKQIFNMEGLQGLKAVIGNVMLPVVLFNAFLKAEYNLRVLVVFLVVFAGFGAAIAVGFALRRFVKPYGKFLPFLLASAEGGMLGYTLYGLIAGSQSGFAAVDLGQTVFAYTVWLGLLTSVDGGRVSAQGLLKNMFSNKCFLGMALGIVLGVAGVGKLLFSCPAGSTVSAVIEMLTAPVSAIVLLIVGYELNLKLELFVPVAKTILFRLLIMGGLLVLSNLIIFNLFAFDKELEIALMILYCLPAPFIIPIFSDVGEDGEYVATALSVHTLVTVILFVGIVAYSFI